MAYHSVTPPTVIQFIPPKRAVLVASPRHSYSPIHSKYCIIDDYIVLEGGFN